MSIDGVIFWFHVLRLILFTRIYFLREPTLAQLFWSVRLFLLFLPPGSRFFSVRWLRICSRTPCIGVYLRLLLVAVSLIAEHAASTLIAEHAAPTLVADHSTAVETAAKDSALQAVGALCAIA